ncbi:MAG TPA: hypothetical protein VK994_00125 [Bacteroidales bacterium]|nr:hypothetical protein [Bacteroidales bacterium]
MKQIFLLSLISLVAGSLLSQDENWLKGYTADVNGEVLTYHSPHPEVTTSLLIRNQDSTKYIEWLMDEIPAGNDAGEYTFVWIFGIDVNENSYDYRLYLDGRYLLTFSNPHDTLVKQWDINGLQGTKLSFNASLVDKYGDLMGYAFLTIPRALLTEGSKPAVRITATSSGDPCWYMTHRYAMNSALLVKQMPALINTPEGESYLLRFDIHHFGEKTLAEIRAGGKIMQIPVSLGVNYTYFPVDGTAGERIEDISVSIDGIEKKMDAITLVPVQPITLYLLHHSHSDIGYTHHQHVVERKHHGFFREVVELWEKTRDYPEGSRFKWNTEVTWAVESYLETCSTEDKEAFIKTVQEGGIGIDGLWANELTGICRPEELMQLIQRSATIAGECGVDLRSAMITDIPGYSWGLVPVMAKSGIRYFSPGTNVFHRIGNIKDTWGDKPFYWVSQSGQDSVLTWFPAKGYSWFHTGLGSDKPKNLLTEEPLFEYLEQLEKTNFPYDISIFRYNIGSDNGPPHAELPDIIRAWNEKYSSPKIIIATTAEAFSIFEDKYGRDLPSFSGALTPYWSDGAASSATETAINRAAAERLAQAQTLWVMSGNKHYPNEEIRETWKNILFFDEHTWGSWNSISAPHDTFTINQWNTKRQFALDADELSEELLSDAIATLGKIDGKEGIFDIWNTHSWPVSDIIMLPVPDDIGNAYVTDKNNNRLPAQRLSDGSLAVLVMDVPPFSAKRVFLKSDQYARIDPEPWLQDPLGGISVNSENGDLYAFRHPLLQGSLVDISMGYGLNSYIYVEGRDPQNKHTTRNVNISYPDKGKLISTIRIESEAPGTSGLIREIRLIPALNRLDITNTIFKDAVYEPEGVHFGFPFNLSGGEVNIGIPWGYYRPEAGQLPGANKNYYTMNRWVDVSSDDEGVCLVSADAPMLELGEISTDATIYGWRKVQGPTQRVFSYVMNNYWETNYLAAQPGKAVFRYSLCINEGFDPVENEKRSLERAQPLVVIPSQGKKNLPPSLLSLDNQDVIIETLIPGEDGTYFLARLYNPTGREQQVQLLWNVASALAVKFSTSGLSGQDPVPFQGPVFISPHDFVTIRCDY